MNCLRQKWVIHNYFSVDDKGGPHLRTVLILDDDLGFVFWLGHLLDTAGYSALPAKSVPDAAMLIMQLDLRVDVLLVNLALAGAADFIGALHRSQQDLKVIGVLNDPAETAHIPRVNAVQLKNPTLSEAARLEWLECVALVLGSGNTPAHQAGS